MSAAEKETVNAKKIIENVYCKRGRTEVFSAWFFRVMFPTPLAEFSRTTILHITPDNFTHMRPKNLDARIRRICMSNCRSESSAQGFSFCRCFSASSHYLNIVNPGRSK